MIPRFATTAMASPKPERTQHKLLRDPLSELCVRAEILSVTKSKDRDAASAFSKNLWLRGIYNVAPAHNSADLLNGALGIS